MNRNLLTTLDQRLFENLSRLQKLNLSYNRLENELVNNLSKSITMETENLVLSVNFIFDKSLKTFSLIKLVPKHKSLKISFLKKQS